MHAHILKEDQCARHGDEGRVRCSCRHRQGPPRLGFLSHNQDFNIHARTKVIRDGIT